MSGWSLLLDGEISNKFSSIPLCGCFVCKATQSWLDAAVQTTREAWTAGDQTTASSGSDLHRCLSGV